MIHLGLDPGSKNYGYALVDHTKGVCLQSGELSDTLKEIKSLTDDYINMYIKSVEPLIKKSDCVFMERFQGRGLRGALGEKVSIMIGINLMLCLKHKKEYKLVTAAIWKNQVKRESVVPLDVMYKASPSPHSLDAALMTYYGKSYHWTTDAKTYKKFMVRMQ